VLQSVSGCAGLFDEHARGRQRTTKKIGDHLVVSGSQNDLSRSPTDAAADPLHVLIYEGRQRFSSGPRFNQSCQPRARLGNYPDVWRALRNLDFEDLAAGCGLCGKYSEYFAGPWVSVDAAMGPRSTRDYLNRGNDDTQHVYSPAEPLTNLWQPASLKTL
jgi:hypothetical protein